jgi:hypothetical protein
MLSTRHLSPLGKDFIGKNATMLRNGGGHVYPGQFVQTWKEIETFWHLPSSCIRRLLFKEEGKVSLGPKLKSGRKFKLSAENAEKLVDKAVRRRSIFKVVNLRWTCTMLGIITNGVFDPTFSWASKFWRARGWTSHRATPQSTAELDPRIHPEAVAFVAEVNNKIREFLLPPEQVWCFDETGVWSGMQSLMTLVDPTTKDTRVKIIGNMARDSLILAVNQSGGWFSKFVEHTEDNPDFEEDEFARKRVHGVGLAEMIAFAKEFTEAHPEGGIMIQDNLRCHHNANVTDIWEQGGFHPIFIPPYGAKYASPLDNTAFSAIKAHLRVEDTSTTRKKVAACRRVLRELDPTVIPNCFIHCGYEVLP